MKRHKRRQAKVQARQRAQAGVTSWGQIWEAAARQDFSGYFYFPTLNPREQLDEWTLQTLSERSDWLYKNVGAVAMVIDGLALDEVGQGLWPKWVTPDREYNQAMTDHFHWTCHDPRIFSADAHDDYYSVQLAIRRLIRLHGNCYGQLLRPARGQMMPSHHLIPGWRVRNFGDEKPGSGWTNGVQVNRLGRAVAYKVVSEDGRSYQVVSAEDMLAYHEPYLPGQVRGAPALASVAKRLLTREDILRALRNGTLARERLGFAIQMKEEGNGGPTLPLLPGGVVEEAPSADGGVVTVQKFFGTPEQEAVQVPTLPAGAEIKTLESSRPGTQVMEFLDSILREVGWRTTYPPEYVFFLAGMGQGTAVRLTLQKVQTVIASVRAHQLVPQFCNRWNVYFAWQRIKAGFYDGKAPDDWWKHKIIMPANISVDVGREGRLYDSRVATSRMSLETYHGLSGEDPGDVEDENLARWGERKRKLDAWNKEHNLSVGLFEMWPRTETAPPPVDDATDEDK